MKRVFLIPSFCLAFMVFSFHNAKAQRDTVNVERRVIVTSEGDTVIVMNSSTDRMRIRGDRGQNLRIEREITIDSDGDTTAVEAMIRDPRFRMRFSNRGDHRYWEPRQRSKISRRKRNHRNRMARQDHSYTRELREMEAEARGLARELRQAEEDTRDEKEQRLREQLEKIFDYKQVRDMEEVDQKRTNLDERQLTLEERRNNKDSIIQDRMNQLLGRGSSYRW